MTKETESALDGADLGRGYDDIDIFGLDEFGDPAGLGAIYGAVIGTGAGTIAAIATRAFAPQYGGYSELIGLGVGLAAGGIMAAMPKTRHAGWVAMASAVLNNGLRAAEIQFNVPTCPTGKDWDPATGYCRTKVNGAFGPRDANPTYANQNGFMGAGRGGLGLHEIQPLNGHGQLGMLQAEALNGPGGVELLGPQTSSLSKSYGANYLYR